MPASYGEKKKIRSKQGNEKGLLLVYYERFSREVAQVFILMYQKAIAGIFDQSPGAL